MGVVAAETKDHVKSGVRLRSVCCAREKRLPELPQSKNKVPVAAGAIGECGRGGGGIGGRPLRHCRGLDEAWIVGGRPRAIDAP
jgi:hypothetical protein